MLNALAREVLRHPTSRHVVRHVYLRLRGSRPFQGSHDERLPLTSFLSCDAFDTLITRPLLRPTDVFLLCGVELRKRGLITLDPSTWRALRHGVEVDMTARVYPAEVVLETIYEHLVRDGALAAENADEALVIEREMEQSITRPIAQTISAVKDFRAAGGTVCVLSDTYLSQPDVCRLLRRNGLTLRDSAVFTSSQTGHTKRGGGLFGTGLARLDVSPGNVLHIGDNLQSDVTRAKAAGLSSAPFLDGRANRFELCLYDKLREHEILATVVAGSARSVRLGRSFTDPHHQTIWNTSAGLSGPLLFSYVAWVLREAVRLGLSRLYFLARDGEILLKVARELQPILAPAVDCRYLFASRRGLHLPAVLDWGKAEREWALDAADRHSFRHFVTRLDLSLPSFLHVLPSDSPLHFIDPDLHLGGDAGALLSPMLELPAVQTLVLRRAAARRRECLTYLKGEALLAPGVVGIVDIGWRGRLQRSFCRLLSTCDPNYQDRLHGFYIDLEEEPDGCGTLATFNALCGAEDFRWSKRGALFEIFCAAHHGTVLRYLETGPGQAEPELASPSNPEAESWGLTVQQDGIVAFAQEAVRTLRKADINPGEHVKPLARASLALTRLFVERPSRDEAACYGAFTHAEDETHSLHAEIGTQISLNPLRLWQQLNAPAHHRRISHWPEASVARTVPPWLRGPALRALRYAPGRRI